MMVATERRRGMRRERRRGMRRERARGRESERARERESERARERAYQVSITQGMCRHPKVLMHSQRPPFTPVN
jgi:hypothetical protein